MSDQLSVLVLTYTTFAREPRALKQARYLQEKHHVTTAGFGPAPLENVDHLQLAAQPAQRWGALGRVLHLASLGLRLHRFITRLSARDREVLGELSSRSWDIVIAHDLWCLEAALSLKPRLGVVLDLHEYAPGEASHSLAWRLVMKPYVEWLLRKKMPLAAHVVTVGEGIAERYRVEYGQHSTVVTNATPYHDLSASEVGSPIRLVHSGVAAPERSLGRLIEAVIETPANVSLDFYLVDNGSGELERLRALAEGRMNITFNDPVPYEELVQTLNTYDVGLSVFPPVTFNLEWCLPNKFFDFIQARLAVVVGPSPEMARVVREHSLGVVLDDFESATLARALERMESRQVQEWKQNASDRAQYLSSERQMDAWDVIVNDLLTRPN